MANDPLRAVLTLRRRAVDEARLALSASIERAAAAEARAQEVAAEIAAETHRASDPDGDDALVEAFAAWLPTARARLDAAWAEAARHAADAACHRADLSATRAALDAVETLMAQRRARAEAAQDRQFQRSLDDAASRPVEGR